MIRSVPPTTYSSWARWILDALIRPSLRRSFCGLFLRGGVPKIPSERPLLIVSNHMSWWDAFLILELQRVLRPGAPIFTIALEETLRQHPFLGRVGLIPLNPSDSLSFRRVLKAVTERISSFSRSGSKGPAPIIVFFPQGKIRPAWASPLGFRDGIALLARALPRGLILPLGMIIEPLNQKRPSVWLKCGEPLESDQIRSSDELEAAVQGQLQFLLEGLRAEGEAALFAADCERIF